MFRIEEVGFFMKIKIYTTPTCPYCVMAKEYFRFKKLPFEEVDVSQNQDKAEELIKLSGQIGVPVIKIDDKVIVGFDQERIESALSQ